MKSGVFVLSVLFVLPACAVQQALESRFNYRGKRPDDRQTKQLPQNPRAVSNEASDSASNLAFQNDGRYSHFVVDQQVPTSARNQDTHQSSVLTTNAGIGDRNSANVFNSVNIDRSANGYAGADQPYLYGPQPGGGGSVLTLAQQQQEVSRLRAATRVENASVTCDRQQFNIEVRLSAPFQGVIYTGDPRCNLVNAVFDDLNTASRFHRFTIPLNACDTVKSEGIDATTGDPYTDYTSHIWIQPDPGVLRGGAAVYQMICRLYRTRDSGTARSDIVTDKIQVLPPQTEVVQNSVQVDPEMNVQFSSQILFGEGPYGAVVDRPIALGERLTYVFRCVPIADIDCAVGRCTAKGVSDTAGGTEIELTDQDGCSLQPNFWSNFEHVRTGSRLEKLYTSSIWAWSLHASNNIVLTCQLRACAGECVRKDCQTIKLEPRQRDEVVELNAKMKHLSYIDNREFQAQVAVQIEEPVRASDAASAVAVGQRRESGRLDQAVGADDDTVTVSRPLLAVMIAVLLITVGTLSFIILMLLYRLHQLVPYC